LRGGGGEKKRRRVNFRRGPGEVQKEGSLGPVLKGFVKQLPKLKSPSLKEDKGGGGVHFQKG